VQRVITVFGSSRPPEDHPDYDEARLLGRLLCQAGFAVCSGGYGGVMEAVSRGAKECGGKTYGVTAEFFQRKANRFIDTEIRVLTWQERLFELLRVADGLVACKGGTGTLAELAVAWEMVNKSVICGKPLVALGEFWIPIVERVREIELGHPGDSREARGQLVRCARTPQEVAEILSEKLP
jgi:uncharacterized protein (TIGR00725 family)